MSSIESALDGTFTLLFLAKVTADLVEPYRPWMKPGDSLATHEPAASLRPTVASWVAPRFFMPAVKLLASPPSFCASAADASSETRPSA